MTVYVIGGSGLKAIGNERICVHAGGEYHYGYNSSPDSIWVESVADDRVTFYRYPYGDKNRQTERLDLFKSIAEAGTRTKLESIKRLADGPADLVPEWVGKLIRHYTAVLNGHEGLTWDRDDIRMVRVEFKYTGSGDGWSEFEKHYPHSISGEDTATGVYDSYDFSKAEAAELCHRMNCGELPGFEYVGSQERE